MKSITIDSFSDFVAKVCNKKDAYNPDIDRYRSNFVYRGMTSVKYRLEPSIHRLQHEQQLQNIEKHLLRNFKKYARISEFQFSSDWEWLAYAQHHGLPTRLLDWTYSPFVAAHFATEGDTSEDCVIWAINFIELKKLLPKELKEIISNEKSDVFTAKMLEESPINPSDIDQFSDKPFLVFFEPPSLDSRIVNQFGLFSFLSKIEYNLDQWLDESGNIDCIKKFIIKSKAKKEVRDWLDQLNINERVLFPGPDGISAWLKRHYTDLSV